MSSPNFNYAPDMTQQFPRITDDMSAPSTPAPTEDGHATTFIPRVVETPPVQAYP